MWRPGRWIYVDENGGNDPEQEQATKSAPPDHSSHRRSCPFDPPSPPWKLAGQVPVETAVFKDGRRQSKRFEKLLKEKQDKTKSCNPNTTSYSTITTRKERSKSVISNNSASLGNKEQQNPPRRSRKSSSVTSNQIINSNIQTTSSALDESSKPSSSTLKNSPPISSEVLNASHKLSSPSTSLFNPISPSSTLHEPIQLSLPPSNTHHVISSPPLLSVPESDEPAVAQSTRTSIGITHHSHTATENQELISTQLEDNVAAEPSTSLSLPPQIALSIIPTKRFRPWEALKGIQTDGAEVAGDLKLIQEGTQSKLTRYHHTHRKRDAPSAASTSDLSLTQPAPDHLSFERNPSPGAPSSASKHYSDHSSDLTELSSSLTDLSDEDDHCPQSSSAFSESELEDECLPHSLVRTVRRPTSTPRATDKPRPSKLKTHRRHRRRRASRPDASSPTLDDEEEDEDEQRLPPPYMKIKSNVYPYRKPEVSDLPPAICGCTDGGCGEKCLNRVTSYLCDPKRCSLGQSCTNIPLNLRKDLIDESTQKLGKGLKVFYTGEQRGWGLKTEIRLKAGIFLIDYRGEIISRECCYKRVVNDYRGMTSFYFLDYDGSDVIDAGKKGNCSRFINHSCEPNLRVERFKLSGLEEYQIGLFTLRDIEIDEELSYNYGWQNFSDIAPTSNIRTSRKELDAANEDDEEMTTATAPTIQRCHCRSKVCKGFLGPKKKEDSKRKGRLHE
ncbi:hypothetical protein DFH28DRAFT_1080933 [Melampsora americana]|nr:hypothetical protein DFH28DRAFT_1080933 [Melampsora americana]